MAIPVIVATVVKGIHSAATHTIHFASNFASINTANKAPNLYDISSNVRTDTTDKTKKHENHISKAS